MHIDEREQSAILARLLTLARPLALVCRTFAVLLLLWIVWMRIHGPIGTTGQTIGVITASAWAYGEWIAARIGLDRSIFEAVGAGTLTLAQLDEALGRSSRRMADRRAGTLRLLRHLGITAIALLGAAIGAITLMP